MTDLYVAKVPDKTILDMLTELKEKYGVANMSVDLGGLPLPEGEYNLLRKKKGPTFLVQSFSFSSGEKGFSINMNRGNVLPSLNPAYHDVITFSPVNGRVNVERVLEVEEVIHRHLTFPKGSDAKGLAESTLGIIDRETASLAQLHHTMLESAEGLRISYEEDAAERRKKFEEQQFQAEEEIRKREAESLERINSEKTALDEKIKEFDQSDHMFARRKLREDITTQVQGFLLRPPSSKQSFLKLTFLMWICVGGAVLAGGAAFYTFQSFVSLTQERSQLASDLLAVIERTALKEPAQSKQAQDTAISQASAPNTATETLAPKLPDNTILLWMLALRGLLLSAVAVGFIAYLVSFLRRSYDSELRTMQELQRYGMDINRASWVIETAMEMTNKEGAQLPEKWVEGACAGLFQTGTKGDSEVSSLAALGAVMGLGPEVSVGPGGATIKLPPKATKKAANDAD